MSWVKRFGLFVLTNLLIMIPIAIISYFFVGPTQSGGQLNYENLLIWAALWGFGGAFISLALSRWMAKKMMGVRVIDPVNSQGSDRELLERVHALAARANLPMPEVGIYESPEVNAFATGPSKKRSLVAVSRGLLQRMDSRSVEGVLAHEVAHIANGDMVTLTLVQGLVNTFVLFFARIAGFFAGQAVDEDKRVLVEFGVYIAAQIAFGILGSIVVAWFSRAREFRADSGGARLAGREKMVAALESLRSNMGMIDNDSSQEPVAAFKISNTPSRLSMLFSTHPPLDERIQALMKQPIS